MNVVLTTRGTLHRWPAWEACNLDDSEDAAVIGSAQEARQKGHYRRDCKRCAGQLDRPQP